MARRVRAGGPLVLLDANVLYPITECDFLLTASSLQLIARPIVTELIIDEAMRNVRADRPSLDAVRIGKRFDAIRLVTDGHEDPPPARFDDDSLINMKDRHVLAAALHHRVAVILTHDVGLRAEIEHWITGRDARAPRPRVQTPDEFVAELIAESPERVADVVIAMAARMRSPARSAADVAEALTRRLPALAVIALELGAK